MPYSIEQKRFGFALEGTRLDAESTPTVWQAFDPESELDVISKLLEDSATRGIKAAYPPVGGPLDIAGKLGGPVRAQNIGELLHMCLGDASTAGEASFVVDSDNEKINFNIGAGELIGTIANATYAPGLLQTDVGSLCEAIFDAIVAAEGTGTYTVTFSRSTKKFSLTRSAGTFELMWKTGTNGSDGDDKAIDSLIGFDDAADDTGSLSYTGDSAVTVALKHTFNNPTTVQIPTYTIFMDRKLSVKKYNGCGVKKLTFTGPVDGPVTVDAEVLGLAEASGDIGSPTFVESGMLATKDCTFKIADSANQNVKSWTLNIDNGMQLKRSQNQSQAPQDIVTPGRMLVDGTFLIYFENETERAKFLANTTVSLQIILAGETIVGAFKYTVDFNVYDIRYQAFPWGAEEGLLAASATFKGYYSTGDSKLLQVDLTNVAAAYA